MRRDRGRSSRGAAILEAAAISALMLPILLAGLGLSDYIASTRQLSAYLSSVLQQHREAPLSLSATDLGLRVNERRQAMRALVDQSCQRISESQLLVGSGPGGFYLECFYRSTAVHYRIELGSVGLRAELNTATPSGQSHQDGAYSLGARAVVKLPNRGVLPFLKSLGGLDVLKAQGAVHLRGEVVWE